jgi:poly-gamma-glutamate synthesis protein (capsule biosynthesis protein)
MAVPIRLFLCGDVMTGRGIDQILPRPGDPALHEGYLHSALDYVRLAEKANGPIPQPVDPDYIWGEALEVWRRAAPDLRIGNLETSVTRSEDWLDKGINYRMSPENAQCLRAARFDGCALANNHVLDFGRRGLLDTLDGLRSLGIRTAGAGRDASEASAPALFEAPSKGRVLLFALATESSGVPRDWAASQGRPGVNLTGLSDADARVLCEQIERVKRPGDVAVVSIHWGANWGYAVPEAQSRFARALIDLAGVSIVYGHSSHHPKGLELHRGRLILYGCGDFINDYEGIGGYEEFRPDLSLMYFPEVDPASGALAGMAMMPMRIRRFRLERAPHEAAAWIASILDGLSRGTSVRLDPADSSLHLSP